MSNYFKNQLRGYPVVLAILEAYSKDICRNCIGLEGTRTKVEKGLKKLSIDLKGSSVPEKEVLLAQIDALFNETEAIELSENCECQKTAGNCKIGTGCFPLGALDILKLITEPAYP